MHINVKYLLIMLGLFIAEILIATTFSNIEFIRASLGDYLVVILIYCFIKTFWDAPPLPLSLAVFLFACAVEILQYFHIADALNLAPGSLPAIIIGTSFSWMDILMYFLGGLTCWMLARLMAFIRAKAATVS